MCPLQSTGNLSRGTHHPQLPMAVGGGGFLRCRAFRTVPGPLGQLVSLPQHQWLFSTEGGEKTGMKFNRLGSEWELRNVLAGGMIVALMVVLCRVFPTISLHWEFHWLGCGLGF